jgi:DNA (cytosine-5)-methyltransferase 1
MPSSLRYLSVCSGIEAASVAWHPLGWTPVAFSEIEPFPSAVLAHRFPDVPNLGDMTAHATWPLRSGDIDILVGGTPCQSFSVAGLRRGLSDPRGGLMLTYLEIAQRLRPQWIVWENVPGVLSSGRGRDFGSFLGALGELGYGWAYRVLDAQWCRTHGHPRAVPQRRRRVFVVGCLGDAAAAAAVLFERESVRRDPAPRAASRQGSADDAAPGARAGRWWDGSDCAATLTKQNANGAQRMPDKDNFNAVLTTGYRWQNNRVGLQEDDAVSALRASLGSSGFSEMNHPVLTQAIPFRKSKRAQSATDDESWIPAEQANTLNQFDSGERDTHVVAFHPTQDPISSADGSTHCMGSGNGGSTIAVGFIPKSPANSRSIGAEIEKSPTVTTHQNGQGLFLGMTVRRLTPRECERLQGFPDDWTLIPWRKRDASDCPDGPRYKALGNSMAVNCMEWIGERIAAREAR